MRTDADETDNEISAVTRRAIIDHFELAHVSWSGRMEEDAFLSRLYDLTKLPSTDYRYRTAAADIHQHRVRNNDGGNNWVFFDGRFNLLYGPDEEFLRFLTEAQRLAAVEIASTRETLRTEAQQAAKEQLTELRAIAKKAEYDRLAAEKQLLQVETASQNLANNLKQTKASLTAERLARQSAENDRERFRAMWADADNQLISMQKHHELWPRGVSPE